MEMCKKHSVLICYRICVIVFTYAHVLCFYMLHIHKKTKRHLKKIYRHNILTLY